MFEVAREVREVWEMVWEMVLEVLWKVVWKVVSLGGLGSLGGSNDH